MKIIGIDPGYAIMGYGVIEKDGNNHRLVDYGVITTDKDMPMPDRLKTLYNGLMDVISEHQPEEAAIEQLYFNTNQTTAISVGQARGVAILACANNGLGIYEYTPLQIKTSITGYGRAEKSQVMEMTRIILGLDGKIPLDDTADALAIAVCHAHCSGSNVQNFYNLKKKKMI